MLGDGLGAGDELGLGSGLGLVIVALGDGLGLADGDGVDVSDGEALADAVDVSVGDADAEGLVAARLLLTNAAVSTDVAGGVAQIVLVACGVMVARAACDSTVPMPRTVHPAAAHSTARLANSDLTTASSIQSVPFGSPVPACQDS